jgi:hypothetical protein
VATTIHGGALGAALAERPHVLPREAERVLGCSAAEVRKLLRAGSLADGSPDRWLRIDVESLTALVDERIAAGRLDPSAPERPRSIVRRRLRV